jgi:hypothetical protein
MSAIPDASYDCKYRTLPELVEYAVSAFYFGYGSLSTLNCLASIFCFLVV